MMRIIGPLRGQEQPCRVMIESFESPYRAYFQVTAPREMERICVGRPIEELPGMLSVLGASHHVVSAMTLDRLFAVRPPSVALNLRQALVLADRFSHHLNRFYFFCCIANEWFVNEPFLLDSRTRRLWRQIQGEIVHARALGQEATTILGGSSCRPVSCMAGGVSKAPGDIQLRRLEELAVGCSEFAGRFYEFFQEEVLEKPEQWAVLREVQVPRMPVLTLSRDGTVFQLFEPSGNKKEAMIEEFPVTDTGDKVLFKAVRWSYEPIAFLPELGQPDLEINTLRGFFWVGALARLMAEGPSRTRNQEISMVPSDFPVSAGKIPVIAGYWAILVEMVETAGAMKELYTEQKLQGSDVRVVARQWGEEGCGALEGPNGPVFHRYRTDAKGLVRSLMVLDPAKANNALRCALVRNLLRALPELGISSGSLKGALEICLIPF